MAIHHFLKQATIGLSLSVLASARHVGLDDDAQTIEQEGPSRSSSGSAFVSVFRGYSLGEATGREVEDKSGQSSTNNDLTSDADSDTDEHALNGEVDGTQLSAFSVDNDVDEAVFSSAVLEQAYSDARLLGMSDDDARDMGIEWRAAGLAPSQIIGGVDSECDSNQFDSLDSIEKKARFACKAGIAGMMNWRLDNDFFESDGECAPGWPKPEGSGPTFKGTFKMREALQRHCKGKRQPRLFGYLGTGINYDINNDTWNSRGGKPLWEVVPYGSVDRLYLAFANIVNCTFMEAPPYLPSIIQRARSENPNLEIFYTASCNKDQYMLDTSTFCTDPKAGDTFTNSLVETLTAYDLDGFDIDWEDDIDKTAHTVLMERVTKAFENHDRGAGKSKFELSLAVWPTFSDVQYDLSAIKHHAGYVNLMTYGGSVRDMKADVRSFMSIKKVMT
eukprot:TRINITY_DN69316_c0_g1_i1.p1 TRINITY_DN69316_c0_g1~~TRINITY_DN69316_c0_g1_i1.p1  ORF type:complete len:446 (-),score=64.07 TRINITY_DN69316_c0_g1_i1:60-1397(-)